MHAPSARPAESGLWSLPYITYMWEGGKGWGGGTSVNFDPFSPTLLMFQFQGSAVQCPADPAPAAVAAAVIAEQGQAER